MKSKRIILGVVLFFSALCGMKAEHQTSVPPVKAGNFTYTLGSGQKDSLYALTSEWILLYFYEPTCEDCRLLTEQIAGSEILNRLFAEKSCRYWPSIRTMTGSFGKTMLPTCRSSGSTGMTNICRSSPEATICSVHYRHFICWIKRSTSVCGKQHSKPLKMQCEE